jgi:hypothetical protein
MKPGRLVGKPLTALKGELVIKEWTCGRFTWSVVLIHFSSRCPSVHSSS